MHLTANTELRQTREPRERRRRRRSSPAPASSRTSTRHSTSSAGRSAPTGSSPSAPGLLARYTPTFRLPTLSTYTTAVAETASEPDGSRKPITQTMDLGEVGYKYANDWTRVYATAFWTKYDNVGFTNQRVQPQQQHDDPRSSSCANTRTYGLELEGGFYPVDWFDTAHVQRDAAEAGVRRPRLHGQGGTTRRCCGTSTAISSSAHAEDERAHRSRA